jgi:hypothetical protein
MRKMLDIEINTIGKMIRSLKKNRTSTPTANSQ